MGTLVASALIVNYRRILLDPSPGVTWLDAALLSMMNQAQRAIVLLKHEAYTILGPIDLVAGTHQAIPAGGVAILDLFENVANNRAPTQVERALLDASNRFWPAATAEANVQEWTADPRDPTRFRVSPPNTGGAGAIRALYAMTPPAIAAVGSVITLDDIYEMPIQSFVLARAYGENSTRQDLGKSAAYDTDWKQLIGAKTQSQVSTAQKSATPGGA